MSNDVTVSELELAAIKEAYETVLKFASESYRRAVLCRADGHPELVALAPLYQQIGEAWEAHARRVILAAGQAKGLDS